MSSKKPNDYSHPSFEGQIGIAHDSIDPPNGIYARNWGAAKHDAAEGRHGSLAVTALVLSDSENGHPLILVDADLGWWRSLELERRFRDSILKEFDLEETQFIFALTHTHAAPVLTDQIDEEWEGGEMLLPFLEMVRTKTIAVIRTAMQSLQPGVLEWRYGKCKLATARDLPDPENPRRICGFDSESEADDTLLVGRVTDAEGKVRAVIANYACHPTTLAWENRKISPDFIGAMRETVTDHHQGAYVFFLQGASGELSPRYQYVGDTSVADSYGRELGFAVLSTLSGMEPPGTKLVYTGVCESGAPLALWERQARSHSKKLRSHRIEVPLDLKDLTSVEELEEQRLAATERQTQERLRRKRDLRRSLGEGDSFALPVWIWEMGDAVLVANMCEAYSWIQQELRRKFPNKAITYLNLANGTLGYLPPSDLYNEDIYQVWQSPFAAGSLEKLEAEISREIESL